MTKQIKNMNKEELINTFKTLNVMQEDLRQIYEKEFDDRVGDERLFNQIKNTMSGILLAKLHVSERLSSEFNVFLM